LQHRLLFFVRLHTRNGLKVAIANAIIAQRIGSFDPTT
jgi:hypothetical protein